MASWHRLEPDRWDETIRGCPSACGFHTRGWAECQARHDERYRAECLETVARDGTRFVVPLMVRRGALRRGWLARAVSMLPGVYGGPVRTERPMTADDWFSALALLARLPLGRLDLRVGPLDPIPRALVDGLPSVAFARTHVLRLDDLPRDRSSAYRASCRRAVRKAQSAGSSCSRLTSADELDAYYELYLDSVRRWRSVVGNVVLPRRLLQDLSRLPGVEFWGTRTRGGELAAGGVFLFWGRHVIYWHGAMLERLAGGRPSNLLHHAVIGAARERGFELYDFNPSAGIAGVEQFKESFGARRADVILFGWRNPLERRALARRLERDA